MPGDKECAELARFTFPRYRDSLSRANQGKDTIAVAIRDGQDYIGCSLAVIRPPNEAELLSVAVDQRYRQIGVATALIGELERQLVGRGIRRIVAIYLGTSCFRESLERLLRNLGWSTSNPRSNICMCWPARFLEASWVWESALDKDHEVFAWSDLTAEDRSSLIEMSKQGIAPWPRNLSPFEMTEPLEPLAANSLGLRYQGRVAGWVLAHHPTPEIIRYSKLFVFPNLPQKALGIKLVAEAIQRHLRDTELSTIPKAMFQFDADNRAMQRLTLRRLAPFMDTLTLSYEASHMLSAKAS